jgi:hypothetical protein
MSQPLCYFMAEACRHGHISTCSMYGGRDPWEAER